MSKSPEEPANLRLWIKCIRYNRFQDFIFQRQKVDFIVVASIVFDVFLNILEDVVPLEMLQTE